MATGATRACRTHRVYALDLPGFGESNKPVADYSSSFFARFVAAFLDALKVERAVVAGSSLGGLVALHLALSEPSRVEALGLLRVPLFFARPDRVPTEWFEDQQRLTRLPGFLEAVIAALRAQGNFEVQREVLLDQLPQLQMPMLVIWGAYDRIFPKFQAQDVVARLKQGSLEIIPDCGHLPHIERPSIFLAAFGPFLNEQTSSR